MAPTLSIAGGGLAGLACGIRLQERGWQVTVHERQHYPLRKVCGEFLSPQGWSRVQALGGEAYLSAPPALLQRARFYADAALYADFDLRPAARGLSRAALDSALAARFRALGGELREGSKISPLPEGMVDATGRSLVVGPAAWLGWKAYLPAREAPAELAGLDLMMLPVLGGYGDLARLEDGRISVALVAKAPLLLPALLASHPVLAALAPRLQAHAAISGFAFTASLGAMRIGDARRVWPPVVGDGMTQALLSGEALAQELFVGRRTSELGVAWRYRLGQALHGMMLWPTGRMVMVRMCRVWPGAAERAYRWSRA